MEEKADKQEASEDFNSPLKVPERSHKQQQ